MKPLFPTISGQDWKASLRLARLTLNSIRTQIRALVVRMGRTIAASDWIVGRNWTQEDEKRGIWVWDGDCPLFRGDGRPRKVDRHKGCYGRGYVSHWCFDQGFEPDPPPPPFEDEVPERIRSCYPRPLRKRGVS